MDLIDEIHIVDARLHLEQSGPDTKTSFDVVRGLGLQREVSGYRVEEGIEGGPRGYSFIDRGCAECAGGTAEYREHLV